MEKINITINGTPLTVPAGSTILEAANDAGIHIPTLCHLKEIDPRANCRMCLVEVERFRTLQPACATRVSEGMVVRTDTPKIRQARKTNLELILSHHAVDCHHCLRIGNSKCDDLDPKFCEMCFFCDCVRDGFCELQSLAREYKVDVLPYEIDADASEIDESTGSIIRNPNKCIKCRRCVDICNDVQGVHNLCVENRGSACKIVPGLGKSMKESSCVQCGRCVDVCPTGAIFALEHIDALLYHTHKYDVTTVAQISPNVLPKLAELFHLDTPEADIRAVAAGLRKIGVDYVVSDGFALAKAQEAAKKKLEDANGAKGVILTNSYAAEKFVRQNFKELENDLIVYPSVQGMFGEYVKTVFAREKNLDVENIRTISITADNENAAEAAEKNSVDFSLNARELYRMFLRTGVNLKKIPHTELDSLGDAKPEMEGAFAPVQWQTHPRLKLEEAELAGKAVQVAVASNLGQSGELLARHEEGESEYPVIRIQA